MSRPYPPSDDHDTLDQVKQALERSESSLAGVVRTAHFEISSLHRQRTEFAQDLRSAKRRHAALKNITERVCDDCWDLLPAFEIPINERMPPAPNYCTICSQSMYRRSGTSNGEATMPPTSVNILDSSLDARTRAKEVLAVNSGAQAIRGPPRHRRNDAVWYDRGLSSNYHRSLSPGRIWAERTWSSGIVECPRLGLSARVGNEGSTREGYRPNTSNKLTKSAILQIAEGQLKKAHTRVAEVQHALLNWEKYHNQHKEEMEKVALVKQDLEECERKSRKRKLAQLGDTTCASSDDNKCPICFDHPKQIVFQCGHQCCEKCSQRVTARCHTCRKTIEQRIKLY